jgi:hypothetical protein
MRIRGLVAYAWAAAQLALLGIVLAGCASLQGVEQFEEYRRAFERNHATAGAILDQLAIQERKLFLKFQGPRGAVRFDPAYARYYTDSADPPGTAAFRRALDTVKAYNDLLYGLASGQTSEALISKAGTFHTKLAEASSEVGGLVGIGAATQLGKVSLFLNTAFTTIRPFAQTALTLRSRAEFRRYAIEYYPPVREILVELRTGTGVIFPILAADALDRLRRSPTGNSKEDLDKIDTYRKLLADWVILIDGSIKALDLVKLAVEADPTIVGAIAGLTATTIELESTSQAARKHLAELAAK